MLGIHNSGKLVGRQKEKNELQNTSERVRLTKERLS